MTFDSFRLTYSDCYQLLKKRIREGPLHIQFLTGPRQVGKTTLLLELARDLGNSAYYATADGPEAALPGFWERIWIRAEEISRAAGSAFVLLDEIHLLPHWSRRLKGEWDRIRRHHRPISVIATGSSALHLATGSRESLAGRFEKITLTHWTPASLVEVFQLSPKEAIDAAVHFGTYPGVFNLPQDQARRLAYLRDAIVEPAIGRDILALAPVRKPGLLRQVFGICISSPAQIVTLQKIQGQLHDTGALETIAHYLALLEEAYLVTPLLKFSPRPARQRSSPPKIVVLNNALLAAMDPRGIPDPATDPARFGLWVENACLAHAWNQGQSVHYWREEPFEVDGVLDGSWGRWVVEIKTGAVTSIDLKGLAEFHRRHPDYRPLLVCDPSARLVAQRAEIEATSWQEFLISGPTAG